MTCLPWDVICIIGETLAPVLQTLWLFIQAMAYIFGTAVTFRVSRIIYKGRFWEINMIIALIIGYLCFTIAGWLALFGTIAAVVVILLAIFTPVGGFLVTWVLGKLGQK